MRIDKEGLLRRLVGSKLKNRVLQFLISNNAPTSERQLAQILGVSHVAVNKSMKELLEYGVVKATSIGSALVWQMNDRSLSYNLVIQYMYLKGRSSLGMVSDRLKAVFTRIRLAFLENLLEKIKNLEETEKEEQRKYGKLALARNVEEEITGYVIGSVSEGTAYPESDVDLVIIAHSSIREFLRGTPAILNEEMENFYDETGNRLSIQIFTKEEIEKKPELHWVQEAIQKGIKVYP